MNQKRIIFQLESKLAEKFDEYARTKGIPKSYLIREWIDDYQSITLQYKTENSSKKTTYNFRLHKFVLDKIDLLRSQYCMSRSMFLRILIQNHLYGNSNTHKNLNLRQLFLKGEYDELSSIFGSKPDKLNDKNLILYARMEIDRGNIQKAEKILELIEYKFVREIQNFKLKGRLLSMKAEIARFHKDIVSASRYIDEGFEIANRIKDRELLGIMNFHLGDIHRNHENVSKAIFYFEIALEYFDIQNHPLWIIKTYLRLYNTLAYESTFSLNTDYLMKAKRIIDFLGNKPFKAWYLNEMGYYKYIKGDLYGARGKLKNSISILNKIKSNRGLYYDYIYLAEIEIHDRNLDQALKYFEMAENKELMYRPDTKFSTVNFQKCYIKSKSNYKDSISKMNRILEYQGIKTNYGNYFLNCVKYINGPSNSERNFGKLELQKISQTGGYNFIKESALKTLQTKNLVPFI